MDGVMDGVMARCMFCGAMSHLDDMLDFSVDSGVKRGLGAGHQVSRIRCCKNEKCIKKGEDIVKRFS